MNKISTNEKSDEWIKLKKYPTNNFASPFKLATLPD